MKKTVISFLVILLVAFNLFACTNKTENASNNEINVSASESVKEYVDVDTSDFSESDIKTFGDLYKYKNDEFYNYQDGYNELIFQMAIEINNAWFRATADLPKDVYEKLQQADFEKRDEAIKEYVLPLKVAKLENLNTLIPSQKELNQYVGKTGKDLFDNGWTYMYYNVEDVSAGLYHGPFLYDVLFDANGKKMVNTDDFDFYKEFAEFKVLSVNYTSVGDAIELD